ncbi:MAG: ATP-dependent DNA helicase RecG [bacterium]|nr:ATP-dependent DNA helicase RecG [bacterium]
MSELRIRANLSLDDPVTRVRQVSEVRARAFAELGISTVRDLVLYAPFRYIDFTDISTIASCVIGEKCAIVGTIDKVEKRQLRHRRMSIVEASVVDATGAMKAVWFNQPWVADKLESGSAILMQGAIEHYNGFKQISSPIYRILEGDPSSAASLGVQPVYRSRRGLTPSLIAKIVSNAIDDILPSSIDPLSPALRVQNRICSRQVAISNLHRPASMKLVKEAKRRLAYEEMLLLQLHWLIEAKGSDESLNSFAHNVSGEHLDRLFAAIPYELTADQNRAVADILEDMGTSKRMNRLLLGDVGSGKTVVAALALACVSDSGSQGAMMAPTEVLCRQYAKKIGQLFDAIGIRWAMLTSSTTPADRRDIVAGLATGAISVVFGTHAIIEDDIAFNDLTLVVIDEQHRFGVQQREKLRSKGPRSDYLCMTATPIPRSLALTIYGTLECSYIREKPTGERQIETKVVGKRERFIAFDAIREAVSAGQQAYIVCPLIGQIEDGEPEQPEGEELEEEFETLLTEFDIEDIHEDLVAARKEAEYLQTQVFPEFRIGLLCGEMSPREKQEVMESFRNHELDVLVSTTVIEVGVDVPNATVMVIEDAERFGLSQLHQLRGRVGRGDLPGRAILIASTNTPESKMRMESIEKTQDGFELAELDLSLRREGDVVGSRQHGLPSLRFTNVIRDSKMIEKARKDAKAILDADPSLSSDANALLAHELDAVYKRGERA